MNRGAHMILAGEKAYKSAAKPATGSIARAARVLDALAIGKGQATLAMIVAHTGFSKTTTHRVLASLQAVNFAAQDPVTRAWGLGTALATLARSAANTDVAALAMRGLDRLADISEDTVYLSAPEGAAVICLARRVGAFPIRTLTLDRHDRRPLGIGSGALAIYTQLTPAERHAACRVNHDWLAEYNTDAAALEAQIASATVRGYVVVHGTVVRGMSAIGMPVLSPDGRPVAALSIAAITERMNFERIETVLLPALRREAANLTERFAAIEDT